MSDTVSQLLSPASSAYPRYAPLLAALATVMQTDTTTAAVTTPPATTPAAPTPPAVTPTPIPAALSVRAGAYALLDGGGGISTFDFGDPSAAFNNLRGYIAAHVYDTPGRFTATVTPAGSPPVKSVITVAADTRPQVSLAAGEDLGAALSKLSAPTVVLLPSGVTFNVGSPITIQTDGITLAAASGPAPRICRLNAQGIYSTLIVRGSDVSIEGIEFDSDQPMTAPNPPKVGVYGIDVHGKNLLVRNCTFRNVDDGLHCFPEARGLVALGCTYTNELRGCGGWLDAMQNVVVLGATAAGSVHEHIFRMEGTEGVLIHGSDLANADGKETIAIRQGQRASVTGNTLRAWLRISEGITAQPGVYCRNVLVGSNTFTGPKPGNTWIVINPGSQTVLIDSNTIDLDAGQLPVSVQAPCSDITLRGNKLSLAAGMKAPALVLPFGNPTFVETGTVVSPATTAAPASAASTTPAKS